MTHLFGVPDAPELAQLPPGIAGAFGSWLRLDAAASSARPTARSSARPDGNPHGTPERQPDGHRGALGPQYLVHKEESLAYAEIVELMRSTAAEIFHVSPRPGDPMQLLLPAPELAEACDAGQVLVVRDERGQWAWLPRLDSVARRPSLVFHCVRLEETPAGALWQHVSLSQARRDYRLNLLSVASEAAELQVLLSPGQAEQSTESDGTAQPRKSQRSLPVLPSCVPPAIYDELETAMAIMVALENAQQQLASAHTTAGAGRRTALNELLSWNSPLGRTLRSYVDALWNEVFRVYA